MRMQLAHAVQLSTRFHARNYRPCGRCTPCRRAGDPHGCWDKRMVWEVEGENLVVTLGRNMLLDHTFNAAAAAVLWYVGLKDTGAVAAGDTMASHAGWAELTPYSNANRPTWTKNGAAASGSMSNSSSAASFNINATATIFGAFLANNNTKGGTTGTLYGAGDFAASRGVVSGDTLNVTVTLNITSS